MPSELAKPKLTMQEARTILDKMERHGQNFYDLYCEFRDGDGWAALGYDSIKECFQAETGKSRRFLNRLLEAEHVAQTLVNTQPAGSHVTQNVESSTLTRLPARQLRALKQLPAAERAAAVEEASKGGRPTEKKIKAAVEKKKAALEIDEDTEPEDDELTVEQEMAAKNSEIEKFARGLTAYAKDNLPTDPWMDDLGRRERILAGVKGLCETARSAKCSKICPGCDGGRCDRCKKTGRVTQLMYQQMT